MKTLMQLAYQTLVKNKMRGEARRSRDARGSRSERAYELDSPTEAGRTLSSIPSCYKPSQFILKRVNLLEMGTCFEENVTISINTEEKVWTQAYEDEDILQTTEDEKTDSEISENNDICYSKMNAIRKVSETITRKETSHRYSYGEINEIQISPRVEIDDIHCKANCRKALHTAISNSLPSPFPSCFVVTQDNLPQYEAGRKTITYLVSNQPTTQKSNGQENGCGKVKYTSLKSEIRRQTVQTSKEVNGLGIKRVNGRTRFSKDEKLRKNVEKQLSQYGIHEEVLQGCLGEWDLIDLDLNVYEEKQAQDVTYLREKRKRKKGCTVFGMRICCWIS